MTVTMVRRSLLAKLGRPEDKMTVVSYVYAGGSGFSVTDLQKLPELLIIVATFCK